MIERPSPPPRPDSPKRSSLLPVVLALFAFIAICASLWLLTMGAFGFILAALLATGGIIALHYFIWGWWLAEIIRREEAEEKES